MIISYHKKTGKIIGTIDGRKHSKDHLNMWIGNREETERIVVTGEIIKKNPYFEKVEILEDTGVAGDLGEAMYRKVVKKVKEVKEVVEAPKTNYSMNTSTAAVKQSKLDKFDSLFDEEESDDLPF